MKKTAQKIPKEKILPKIVLKYYKTPARALHDKPSGIVCAYCFEKDIVKIGGGFQDKKGKSHQICEGCAIWQYRDEHGFRTLPAAKARRRRLFDVGYLFNEMVVDKYMEMKLVKNFDNPGDGVADGLFVNACNLYNHLFSKEEKIKIEEIESQMDIET